MDRDPKKSPDLLIIDQPLLGGLIEILRPKRVIYRPTDAHYDPRTREAERRVVALADGVVATSRSVLDDVLAGAPRVVPTAVLENGVEFERFSEVSESGPRSGAVYVGALDKRFDWRALKTLANAFPNESFKIAGPVPTSKPIGLPSNVIFLGPVSYSDIPKLLNSAKIGLLPMSTDPSNDGRSPMKYYEYLAAGLNIVATSTETLSERTGPGVHLYEPVGDPVPAMAAALASYDGNSLGKAYAGDFSWSKRSQRLMKFIQETGD
ncbi:glycosyltransferase [Arthrobacter sp. OV608]|uniref:glycosyltransferase n=1 Tax=Arthrobacter sp. OV608 TaxID=1882768 RepID=UPI0014801685|nr:glycosyltransferase [Arthrobacter sp. OV608]